MYEKEYYIYIMTNKRNGTFYVGVTSNLENRIEEHKQKFNPKSFTSLHDLNRLVYFEVTNDVEVALGREKQLKRWKRLWKLNLIEQMNANWEDLSLNLS